MPAGSSAIAGLILAAGKGTRMKSAVPKVLHPLAGRPMLSWVASALAGAGVETGCVVLGDDADQFASVIDRLSGWSVAIQEARQGTGDAVAAAAHAFEGAAMAPFARGKLARGTKLAASSILLCAGDTPALDSDELRRFVDACRGADAAIGVLGMKVSDPYGYGRCVTSGAQLTAIVEEKDATPDQRAIDVVNSGVFYARTAELFRLIAALTPANAQKEYYLTDCIAHARRAGLTAVVHVATDWRSFAGVNDRAQLAAVEETLVRRKLDQLMRSGVTIRLPATVYAEADVRCGAETEIGPGSHLSGATSIGTGCRIGAHVRLAASSIGDGASIGDGSVLEGVRVAPQERVPPLSVRLG